MYEPSPGEIVLIKRDILSRLDDVANYFASAFKPFSHLETALDAIKTIRVLQREVEALKQRIGAANANCQAKEYEHKTEIIRLEIAFKQAMGDLKAAHRAELRDAKMVEIRHLGT